MKGLLWIYSEAEAGEHCASEPGRSGLEYGPQIINSLSKWSERVALLHRRTSFPLMVALGKEVIEAWISCFQLQPRTLRFMATSGTDSSNDSWIRYCFHGLPTEKLGPFEILGWRQELEETGNKRETWFVINNNCILMHHDYKLHLVLGFSKVVWTLSVQIYFSLNLRKLQFASCLTIGQYVLIHFL